MVAVDRISKQNQKFWDELCGTSLAKSIGVSDNSPGSLKKFDEWYFDFYPYLFIHIPFGELAGRDVLEVGLGYGSVAQKLAEFGANYTGLDIAAGPVHMVNHRLSQLGLAGRAVQGSILEPPFAHNCFDAIVAIGCLHHTGDLRRAIENCRLLLKPGGKLIFMVYYAYSYRRWRMRPLITVNHMLRETMGWRGVVDNTGSSDRKAYDANQDGTAAPHTDWISKRSLRAYCSEFSHFQCVTENIDQEWPFQAFPRPQLLGTPFPRWAGLDLYATAVR